MVNQNEAEAKFNTLPVSTQLAHKIAWGRAEQFVMGYYNRQARAAKVKRMSGKRLTVFNVHHGIANARNIFLQGIIDGKSPDVCEGLACGPYVESN